MRLAVCAGERRVEGFTHHDIKELPGIDIVCDFWRLPEHIKPDTCEAIQMTHALEHFSYRDTQNVLNTLWRSLRSGGSLYLEVPNFAWHAEQVLKGNERQAVIYAFGGQSDEWDYHKAGFTPTILQGELHRAGFRVDSMTSGSSIECHATKI